MIISGTYCIFIGLTFSKAAVPVRCPSERTAVSANGRQMQRGGKLSDADCRRPPALREREDFAVSKHLGKTRNFHEMNLSNLSENLPREYYNLHTDAKATFV